MGFGGAASDRSAGDAGRREVVYDHAMPGLALVLAAAAVLPPPAALEVCVWEVGSAPCESAGVVLEGEVRSWGATADVALRWTVDGRLVHAGRVVLASEGSSRHLLVVERDDRRHRVVLQATGEGVSARGLWEGVAAAPECLFDLRTEVVAHPGTALLGVVRNAGPSASSPGTARWLVGGVRRAESRLEAMPPGGQVELVVPWSQVEGMIREAREHGETRSIRTRRTRQPAPASRRHGVRVVLLGPLLAGELNPQDNAFELFVTASPVGPP